MSDWFDRYGFAEVADHLSIGAYPQDVEDVARLRAVGVTRVFNLVQDREYARPDARRAVEAALQQAGIGEERLELVDYGGLAPAQIEHAVGTILPWLEAGEHVYLHCRAGWQRSAAIAAAVLALHEATSLLAALTTIQRRKPTAQPLAHQREDLAAWWTQRR